MKFDTVESCETERKHFITCSTGPFNFDNSFPADIDINLTSFCVRSRKFAKQHAKTMALSYFTESEAPRDFRVSSTESDGHYKKCLLCYTVKRNFYCPECIRAGNFVHSSMPYSDR